MNILIIGCSGSIGTHLLKFCLEQNKIKKVYGIDVKDSKIKSKKFIFKKKDLEFLKSDFKINTRIDCAIMLGAIMDFKNIPPLEFYFRNMLIFFNSLKICKHNSIKKIIYLSSAAVYGNLESSCISENDKIHINNIYSDMKVSQENEIKKLSKVGNFNYCILRLFQIYGKNISTNIIYRFIKMKKNNLEVTINGDGKQIRDQLHVQDLVRAIYKISIKLKKQNYVLNVCSGKGIQIINIVKKIGAKFKLNYKDNGEPKLVIGSNKKLTKLINWKPKTSINEGIKSLL